MSSVSRDADRRQLERKILLDDHHELLMELRRGDEFWRQFDTWCDVVAFMRTGTSRDPAKDAILVPIFKAHFADKDPRWRTILLVIFWPALESIHRQKRPWDIDPDNLWTGITWAFLQVICQLDPARRSDRLVQKVFNDTVHRLYDDCRREWDRARREIATDPDELAAGQMIADERHFAAEGLRDLQEARIKHLTKHRDAGRISEADFLLLVGTHVYGRSLADYAREVGMNYEAAKKRQQRASRAIGGFPGPEK